MIDDAKNGDKTWQKALKSIKTTVKKLVYPIGCGTNISTIGVYCIFSLQNHY
jgi:hypothetical protein